MAETSFSHRLKLSRAQTHIKDVEAAIADWSRDGYRVFEETNSKGRSVLLAQQSRTRLIHWEFILRVDRDPIKAYVP